MEYVEYVVQFFATLDPLTKEFLMSMIAALFLGYIMGAERELRHKDAGISTNMFVVCGSMIFTFLSMTVDPNSESRIAAQIVSGIGFLGAGLILKEGTGVRNLTTAASIWYSGAVGMLVGYGFHQIALIAGIAGVIMPRIRHFRNQLNTIEQVMELPIQTRDTPSLAVIAPRPKLKPKKKLESKVSVKKATIAPVRSKVVSKKKTIKNKETNV
jgi:putative Mg2+ transporter-C (MgtC) family protein